MPLETFVVFSHYPHLITDIRKGDPQESVQQLENFAELKHEFEEILKIDLLLLLEDL